MSGTLTHDLFAKHCNESGMDCMISYNADQFSRKTDLVWVKQTELDWDLYNANCRRVHGETERP